MIWVRQMNYTYCIIHLTHSYRGGPPLTSYYMSLWHKISIELYDFEILIEVWYATDKTWDSDSQRQSVFPVRFHMWVSPDMNTCLNETPSFHTYASGGLPNAETCQNGDNLMEAQPNTPFPRLRMWRFAKNT